MAQRFFGTIYFQVFAAMVCVITALLATMWTTGVTVPAFRKFNIRAYGLEPAIKVSELKADQMKAPWAPVTAESTVPDLPPPSLTDLYPPQHPNAPLPSQSAKANELEVNLFYALMYYGHPAPEYAGKRLTLEYDAETGYGRVASDPWESVHEDYLAYATALELHHELRPEVALFQAERQKVLALAPQILSTVPTAAEVNRTPRTPATEPYWMARQLQELTGDSTFAVYADTYGDALVSQGTNYANLVHSGLPRTLYASHFMLPAVMADMAKRKGGDPELQRKAGELMAACIKDLYDPISNTIYNDFGSEGGPGSDTRESVDTFDALMGLWRYYELTGDDASQRLALKLSTGFTPSTVEPSPFMDYLGDIFRLYATKAEAGTMLEGGHVSSALNLRAMQVVQQLNQHTGFSQHDQDFALLLNTFEQKFYDDIHNGFSWAYSVDTDAQQYDPVRIRGHQLLSVRIASELAYLILNDQYARKQALSGGASTPSASGAAAAESGSTADAAADTDTEATDADAEAAATAEAGNG